MGKTSRRNIARSQRKLKEWKQRKLSRATSTREEEPLASHDDIIRITNTTLSKPEDALSAPYGEVATIETELTPQQESEEKQGLPTTETSSTTIPEWDISLFIEEVCDGDLPNIINDHSGPEHNLSSIINQLEACVSVAIVDPKGSSHKDHTEVSQVTNADAQGLHNENPSVSYDTFYPRDASSPKHEKTSGITEQELFTPRRAKSTSSGDIPDAALIRKSTRPTKPVIPARRRPTFEVPGRVKNHYPKPETGNRLKSVVVKVNCTPRTSPSKIRLWTENRDPTRRRVKRKEARNIKRKTNSVTTEARGKRRRPSPKRKHNTDKKCIKKGRQ